MLDHTFIHLPDCGPRTERKLWEQGVLTWDDFLETFAGSMPHKNYCTRIASSKYALGRRDAPYFAQVLPKDELWRCFPHFDRTVYLDIETTGLSAEHNELTVIGLFDGKRTHSYIQGINLEDFVKDIRRYTSVVTFNGSLFDLPFLRKAMPGVPLPALHIDLRFVLSSLGVRGGLKNIEKQFGFQREDDLAGLTGYDAVKLWKKYIEKKDKDVLDRLVRYNAADIGNLQHLLGWAYGEKRRQTGLDTFLTLERGGSRGV